MLVNFLGGLSAKVFRVGMQSRLGESVDETRKVAGYFTRVAKI
jgi:hypothetical protein